MRTNLLALSGIGLASCSTMAIDKLDAYDAAAMGREQVDKCLMSSLHLYMSTTLVYSRLPHGIQDCHMLASSGTFR